MYKCILCFVEKKYPINIYMCCILCIIKVRLSKKTAPVTV